MHAESDILVSMKMRLGYENSGEILKTLPILDTFPLKNIAIHARIGKQLYKGGVDLEGFQKCIDTTKHILYYNGDITSVTKFREMQERFPTITHWMIGRGLIADPFLPSMIKNNTLTYPENKIALFTEFHNTLYKQYSESLSGATHLLLKMYHLWEYFSLSFSDPRKTLKKIKKAKSIKNYEAAVFDIFNTEKNLR